MPDQASASLLLTGSACTAAGRCVAVGTYADGVTLGLVAVGLGGQPSFLAFPGPLSRSTLEAVTTDSPATAVAVGEVDGTGQALLVRGVPTTG